MARKRRGECVVHLPPRMISFFFLWRQKLEHLVEFPHFFWEMSRATNVLLLFGCHLPMVMTANASLLPSPLFFAWCCVCAWITERKRNPPYFGKWKQGCTHTSPYWDRFPILWIWWGWVNKHRKGPEPALKHHHLITWPRSNFIIAICWLHHWLMFISPALWLT